MKPPQKTCINWKVSLPAVIHVKEVRRAQNEFAFWSEHRKMTWNERSDIGATNIDGNPVLHIVDEETKSLAAQFLCVITNKEAWDTIVKYWCLICTKNSNKTLVHPGKFFKKSFLIYGPLCEPKVAQDGIQSSNLLSSRDRNHQLLINTFWKFALTHSYIYQKK